MMNYIELKNRIVELNKRIKEHELNNGRNKTIDELLINIDYCYNNIMKNNNQKDLKVIEKDVNIIEEIIDNIQGETV